MKQTFASALLLGALLGCAEERAGTAGPPVLPEATEQATEQAAAPAVVDAPPEVEQPYVDGEDAGPHIEAALARAGQDGKRVLLVFGANWCVWCRRLDWVLQNEPSVSAALSEGWHVVHVDTGTRGSGTNRDVIARYGDPVQHGLPCLVVLDAEGQRVHTQETGALEDGNRHHPARVVAFLRRFRGS
jgi:thiol:disulfide interchange protein